MATTRQEPERRRRPRSREPDPMPQRDDRRSHDRFDVEWAVDCVADDTFLYASIANISAMGIFVKTTDPLTVGTRLVLSFAPPGYEPFKLEGEVAWINPVPRRRRQPEPRDGRALRRTSPRRARAAGRGHPDHRLRARPVVVPGPTQSGRGVTCASMPTTPHASSTASHARSLPATTARRTPVSAAALATRAAHAASSSSSSDG